MQVVTIKAKPKVLFGTALALTGLIVIILTFVTNHPAKPAEASVNISCATAEERKEYINSLGWEFESEEEREIIIPSEFNEIYKTYNEIQKKQGFDLEEHKGASAVIYTYKLTNYKDNENVIADLIVADGVLIGADLCDPAVDSGFLVELEKNHDATT